MFDMADPQAEILERWQSWLEKLFQQLCELHHDRAIWRELVAMIEANREIPEPWFFLDWVRRLWASTMVVGVRRIADRDRRSVSLARLLAEVAHQPEVLSRKHYCNLFDQIYPDDTIWQGRANQEYDELVGEGATHLTTTRVEADVEHLRQAAATIGTHVNKHVAHTDEHAGPPSATFADLDQALDTVTELYRRYSFLITGSAPSNLTPSMQQDWKQPFLVAWAPDAHYLEVLRRAAVVPRST